MKIIFLIGALLLSSCVFAEETNNGYSFNAKLGASRYTGIFGVEVQKGKWSVGFGLPTSVSLKRYNYENEDSLFYGVYWGKNTDDNYNDFEDGILFDTYERESYGVGVGYIWLWESGWNASTGLSLEDFEQKYTNSNGNYLKTGYSIYLDLSVGYKF